MRAWFLGLFIFAACGAVDQGRATPPVASAPDDGDVTVRPSDAGDAGTAVTVLADAGAATDAGDSGAAHVDAGTAVITHDAGAATDAGAEHVDSGTDAETSTHDDAGAAAQIDGGTTSDAGSEVTAIDAGPRGLELSPHLALGIPDSSGVGRPTRWLLVRPQFVSSYDTTHKVPNWSAWKLDASDLGMATRASSFRMDPLLPSGTPQARDSDYTNSGFDRGHLCPSADRTLTDIDNNATFVLTNVVPQTHASNAGPWLDLEDEGRRLARAGKHLVIIAGPLYGATAQNIGTGVAVPLSMFKVMVVMDAAPAPSSVTSSTVVYAAIIPNASVLTGSWRTWQTTIDTLEQQTGLDFLSDVPAAVQQVLEARVDP